jgi:mannose/fructose-specific phosphotransferase system component IIA
MTPLLRGVVVGHGSVAPALVAAAEEISGIQDALVAVTNQDCDRNDLETRVRQAAGDGPVLVFVDLPTGSCFFAAMKGLGRMPDVRVLTGVNLTMLVDFVFHRDASLDDALARARTVGQRAIAGPG